MQDTANAFDAAFSKAVDLGNRIADKDKDADLWDIADGLLAAAAAGATAVIQPGGSMRDEDVIKAADEAGLAMVFTGVRHFRH